jgi:hypothetical protein
MAQKQHRKINEVNVQKPAYMWIIYCFVLFYVLFAMYISEADSGIGCMLCRVGLWYTLHTANRIRTLVYRLIRKTFHISHRK